MEVLNWELNLVTPILMVNYLLPFFAIPQRMLFVRVYSHAVELIHLMESHYEFLQYLPSELALASIYCALRMGAISDSIFRNAMYDFGNLLDPVRKRQFIACYNRLVFRLRPELSVIIDPYRTSCIQWGIDLPTAVIS